MRATSRSQQSMPWRCASRQMAFRSRSVVGRKVPFPSSDRQRNSVASVSMLKRNSYRSARKPPRVDSRLAAFGSVSACGVATCVVPIVFLAVRFSFHRLTALCAILLKSIVAVFRVCFLPANIRHEKALVKPFTITLLITSRFTFVNRNLYAVYHFPLKDVKAESSP